MALQRQIVTDTFCSSILNIEHILQLLGRNKCFWLSLDWIDNHLSSCLKKKDKGFKAWIILFIQTLSHFLSNLEHSAVHTCKTHLWTLQASQKQLFTFFSVLASQSVTDVRGAVCYCVCSDCHFCRLPSCEASAKLSAWHWSLLQRNVRACMYLCACVFTLTTLSLATINSEREFYLQWEPKASEPRRQKIVSLMMFSCTAESSTLKIWFWCLITFLSLS